MFPFKSESLSATDITLVLTLVILFACVAPGANAQDFIVAAHSPKVTLYNSEFEEIDVLERSKFLDLFVAQKTPDGTKKALRVIAINDAEGLLQIRLRGYPAPLWVDSFDVELLKRSPVACSGTPITGGLLGTIGGTAKLSESCQDRIPVDHSGQGKAGRPIDKSSYTDKGRPIKVKPASRPSEPDAPLAEYRPDPTIPVPGDDEEQTAPEDQAGSKGMEDYQVALAADKEIYMPGFGGELRVWIGRSDFEPSFDDDMVSAEADLPVKGNSATVEPKAPAFIIKPETTPCISIHPSGSEVSFTLEPKETGVYKVGAAVFLYASDDCSGAPVPKSATSLTVNVVVNEQAWFKRKLNELGSILWTKTLDFWGTLVALTFAVFLFLIRKQLKRRFGYEESIDS